MLEVEPVLILRNVYGGPTNLDDSEGTRCGSLGQRLLIKKKKSVGVCLLCVVILITLPFYNLGIH